MSSWCGCNGRTKVRCETTWNRCSYDISCFLQAVAQRTVVWVFVRVEADTPSLSCCCCWSQVCFTWVWCDAGRCEQPAYKEAMSVVWKLLICLTLFSVAGFIKCSLARLLSYQFYRTAHFKKVKQAIERVSQCVADMPESLQFMLRMCWHSIRACGLHYSAAIARLNWLPRAGAVPHPPVKGAAHTGVLAAHTLARSAWYWSVQPGTRRPPLHGQDSSWQGRRLAGGARQHHLALAQRQHVDDP
eukprot:GHRQ01036936.1.p1 GENE.GHRQ01036936.1~~GHRQ01036936.1.p1  ORF type:complete len:244 (-),score=25.16 GHRQ01036936.1:171-902(-)